MEDKDNKGTSFIPLNNSYVGGVCVCVCVCSWAPVINKHLVYHGRGMASAMLEERAEKINLSLFLHF